ncbi:bifunctional chorismate mutase/prephenate dehydrogenase [Candidatus Peregrinibacteria bacterium]|nr:bifunctional chorismate mutase/prephenate dehydrogenase [Candidatus Peregrinibacteria bacterium]
MRHLRKIIDKLDKQIIHLIEKRVKTTEEIAEIKNRINTPLTDLKREEEVLRKIQNLAKSPMVKESLQSIYGSLFELSKVLRIFMRQKRLPFNKIGIIGMGLIGGSIARILKAKNPKIMISAVKRKSKNNFLAKKTGILDKEFDNFSELTENADLIILAAPIKKIIPLAKKIKNSCALKKGKLIVIDISSVKRKITAAFEKMTDEKIEFVSTHPMAGSEKSGFKDSKISLFIDRPWIIVQHGKNSKSALEDISKLILFLGGNLRAMSAAEHDKLIAKISHLPFMLSCMLFSFIQNSKNAFDFSGPGLQSIVRLAAGNADMHEQIFNSNGKNIKKELRLFSQFIKNKKLNAKNSCKFFDNIKTAYIKRYGYLD